ncbi:MAG TPA: thiamine-phosphate kinase [Pseudacidobacterium sp.]|nr:thiamine-phosphate kinase [Pseudacidobacterium sp.]
MRGKANKALVSGERAFISAIRRRAGRSGIVRTGIGDDCAVLRPPRGSEILVTTDFSLEQVHFRLDWHPPESAGHRCLARGLSDLAAMGAKPVAAFLSLALPAELTSDWAKRFLDGLLALADEYGVPLAGGDTAQSPAFDESGKRQTGMVLADMVLIGAAPQGKALLRSGARAGDIIYVTGALGGAAAELLALGREPKAFRRLTKAASGHPHLYPVPRLEVGARLRGMAGAAIDLSDGLSTDLAHVCEESGLSAEINEAAVPIHPLASKAEADGWVPSALHLALNGGEDYELLFTVPAGRRVPGKMAGIPIRAIGRIKPRTRGKSLVEMVTATGKRVPLHAGGWEHFRPKTGQH